MPRKSAGAAAEPTASSSKQDAPTYTDNSILSTVAEPSTPAKPSRTSANKHDDLGIDDLLLPRTLTSRLARGVLPANTSIQKDALLALTKSATVFISYLAAHANEQTQKKTISPQDVLAALKEIELDTIMGIGKVGSDGAKLGRLEREMEVWETAVKGKRRGYRDKVKARESGGGEGAEDDDRGEPETKRVRRDSHGEARGIGSGGEGEGEEGEASGHNNNSMPPPKKGRSSAARNGHTVVNGGEPHDETDDLGDETEPEEEEEDDDEGEGEEEDEDEEEDEEEDEDEDQGDGRGGGRGGGGGGGMETEYETDSDIRRRVIHDSGLQDLDVMFWSNTEVEANEKNVRAELLRRDRAAEQLRRELANGIVDGSGGEGEDDDSD